MLAPFVADEHPVRRRVAERVDRRLLPRQVRRLRHQLVGLHDRQIGEAAVVRLEAPDPLVVGEHRVVVGGVVLPVDVVAVHRDPVARLPVADRLTDAQHDTRRIRADHVERLRVALRDLRLAGQTVEEPERRQWFEDRRPHRVEVDRARHHGDVDLVGGQLGCRDLVDVDRLARILVVRRDAGEHLGLVTLDERRSEGFGDRDGCQLVAGCIRLDRCKDLLHTRRHYPPVTSADEASTLRIGRQLVGGGVSRVWGWCGRDRDTVGGVGGCVADLGLG